MATSLDKSVLFVCLGNICRSTMAEGILHNLVKSRSDHSEWQVDSCGTASYHTGEQPDNRTIVTLQKHGIVNFKHKARKIRKSDFTDFKWIFVMDLENLKDVERIKPDSSKSKVMLLRQYDPEKDCEKPIVIDAYYHDDSYFELCYEQCLRSLKTFLEKEVLE